MSCRELPAAGTAPFPFPDGGLSLAQLLAWLNLPETREQLALRESAAYAHVRHVAALNMEQAVRSVASIVHEYNYGASERRNQERTRPGSAHRASVHARKAAWLLYRFSRITPVNEADLRGAADCLSATSKRAPAGSSTSVNHSAVPAAPLASVPETDTHSDNPVSASSVSNTDQPQAAREAERAQPDQPETDFENQPTVVRRNTRASDPAPSPAPNATATEREVEGVDDFRDPAFADPLDSGSTHAGAALAATGPPHTG